MSTSESEIFILSMYFIFFVVMFGVLLIGAVFYVLESFGLYKIAKRHGHADPWMAWVPYANRYLFASLIGKELQIKNTTLKHFPIYYVVFPFALQFVVAVSMFFSIIPIIGWIFSGLISFLAIAFSSLAHAYVMYVFFKKYKPDQAVLFTVLSIMISSAFSVILFIIRDTASAEIPQKDEKIISPSA